MRISNSSVEMTSARYYTSHTEVTMQKGQELYQNQSEGITGFNDLLNRSEASKNGKESEEVRENSDRTKQKGEGTLFTNYNSGGGLEIQGNTAAYTRISEIENIRMQLMERILNLMQIIYGGESSGRGGRMQNFMRSLSSQMYQGSYQWMSVSTTTYIHTEEEKTAFSAQGIAQTDDGREIKFNVNLNMSRKFTQQIGATHMQPIELIDPLVINVGDGVTEISDQTFTFDLDADGKEEQIHTLKPGAGFLAYDRNGDGVINDGTELFGAKSGDGFTELSEYDSDMDGWIDEDDEIYEKLLVWCKGEDGKDTLMSLKEADVGAIYLEHADTQFTSQGSDFAVNAQFRQSGIFLRESTGDVSMIHQIDMAKVNEDKTSEIFMPREEAI